MGRKEGETEREKGKREGLRLRGRRKSRGK